MWARGGRPCPGGGWAQSTASSCRLPAEPADTRWATCLADGCSVLRPLPLVPGVLVRGPDEERPMCYFGLGLPIDNLKSSALPVLTCQL